MIIYNIEERLNECRARMESAHDSIEYNFFKKSAEYLIDINFKHPRYRK